jgi:hypothetical protein
MPPESFLGGNSKNFSRSRERPMAGGWIRRKVHAKLLVCILLPVLFSCASGHRPPYANPLPVQRDIAALEAGLRGVAAADGRFRLDAIGTVAYPGFRAPVWRLSFSSGRPGARRALINAGIHGNEPAGPSCVLDLAAAISAGGAGLEGWDFDFIPLVNPWGWVHDTRHNREGIDVNRDFAGFRSIEAAIIRDFVNGRNYDLMLDLHEDPSAKGFYVYQYGRPERSLSERVVAGIRRAGYPIEENVRMVILKTENGIIDAPLWGLYFMRATDQLSIANYYRLNLGRSVFTIETPTRLPDADRLRMQRMAVGGYLEGPP